MSIKPIFVVCAASAMVPLVLPCAVKIFYFSENTLKLLRNFEILLCETFSKNLLNGDIGFSCFLDQIVSLSQIELDIF